MEIGFLTSCRNLIERWQESLKAEGSCELDVAEEFHVLAGDVISRTAFGSSYEEGKKIFELQKEQVALVSESLTRLYIPGLRYNITMIYLRSSMVHYLNGLLYCHSICRLLPTKKNKRRYQINDQVKALLHDAVQRKLEAIKRGEPKGKDLLSLLLLHSEDESGKSLRIGDVIEECNLFYFTGHETTANLLTWTMVLLSLHPNWQEKARCDGLVRGQSSPSKQARIWTKFGPKLKLNMRMLWCKFGSNLEFSLFFRFSTVLAL